MSPCARSFGRRFRCRATSCFGGHLVAPLLLALGSSIDSAAGCKKLLARHSYVHGRGALHKTSVQDLDLTELMASDSDLISVVMNVEGVPGDEEAVTKVARRWASLHKLKGLSTLARQRPHLQGKHTKESSHD